MHEHHRDRLRDKIFVNPDALNDYEVLELILFNAIPRKNTNDISHRLLDRFGSIEAVFSAPPEQLLQVEGVGEKTACFLVALGMVFNRNKEKNEFPKIFSFNDVCQPLIKAFQGFTEEAFMAFFLDKRHNVIARKVIYSASKYAVEIDLTDLSKQLVLTHPTFVVIAHNHTSNNCLPSADDDNATEKICMVCALTGTTLLDHIIVAGEKVYSYYYSDKLESIRKQVELKLK